MIHRRALALVGALALALLLGSCGGGKSFKNGKVRLVNLTADALDLRVAGGVLAGNVAAGAASGYVEREEGTTTFELATPGNAAARLSIETAIDDDLSYSIVAYTTEKELAAVAAGDDVGAPGGGKAALRLFNASREAGALDLYATTTNASLSGVTPTNGNIAVQAFGSYTLINPGSYRVRITGTGDTADLRLDVPTLALADGQLVTLIVQASASGVLVNGTRLDQAGAPVAHANGSVRLSVVADATAAGPVTVKAGGNTLVTNLVSPAVTPYLTLKFADLATLTANDVAATGLDAALPGTDLTLLVTGNAVAPAPTLGVDDNRRAASASRARLRLGHGINGLDGALTLDRDAIVLGAAASLGSYSTPSDLTPGTDLSLRVQASGCASAPWTKSPVSVEAGGVYTLFALGECAGTGTLVLRQDR